MDDERTESMNWKTTERRKRLAHILLGMLGKKDMTTLQEYALDQLIDKYIPIESREHLLMGNDPDATESPPSESPHARRPRLKDKAA